MSISTPILKMFGRSPMRPLQQHINKVNACVKTLPIFFEAVLKQDWKTAEKYQIEISNLEKKADHIKKDLRLHLPHSLFLPVARTDILKLLDAQDKIANKAKDIAGFIIGRRTNIPQEIAKPFIAYLDCCINACEQAHAATNEIEEVLKTGFGGGEIKIVENMIVKLDKIEHATDEMQVSIRKKLFKIEQVLPPIDVIFLYKIIELTGELADSAQSVGGRLLLLLAH